MNNIKCGCGKDAQYAVYNDRQPHCLYCMLEAVDVAMGVTVGTLDPWEQYPAPYKGSQSYQYYAYTQKRLNRKRVIRRAGA